MHPVFYLQQPKVSPTPPKCLSHSALTEIERCPRRWRLLHGQYDELGGPYPVPVFAATVTGTIVHSSLNAFAEALRGTGSLAPGSRAFFEVRQTFPVRAIVRQLRREVLNHLANNPRVDVATPGTAVSVDGCIAAFKRLVTQAYPDNVMGQRQSIEEGLRGIDEVQAFIREDLPDASSLPVLQPTQGAELNLITLEETNSATLARPSRWLHPDAVPCPAVLPEVQVELADPPLRGTLDLVVTDTAGDAVVEFKTGEPRPEHEDQSRIYAVLWWRWTGRLIRRRILMYADYEPVLLSGLSADDLKHEVAVLRERITNAQANLTHYPPPAKPKADTCVLCPVRQLCNDYWQSPVTVCFR